MRWLFTHDITAFITAHRARLRHKAQGPDFLTGRPQVVRVAQHVASTLLFNIIPPQSWVCPPLLHSLYTPLCSSSPLRRYHQVCWWQSWWDLISDYQKSQGPDPLLSGQQAPLISQTKELIVDLERSWQRATILLISTRCRWRGCPHQWGRDLGAWLDEADTVSHQKSEKMLGIP